MLVDLINEYRRDNGKAPVFCWDPVEQDYCQLHCQYLAWSNKFGHTPNELLKGKAEAIACCTFQQDNLATMRYLIYECLDKSQEHRDIILNSENLAYGFYIYNGQAYLVIRGWKE